MKKYKLAVSSTFVKEECEFEASRDAEAIGEIEMLMIEMLMDSGHFSPEFGIKSHMTYRLNREGGYIVPVATGTIEIEVAADPDVFADSCK